MKDLQEAIRVAVVAHEGQFDRGGDPHILHSLRVMFLAAERYKQAPLKEYTLEEIMIGGVLHDVVEDTLNLAHRVPVTLSQIESMFGPKVRKLVDGVTRREGPKEVYKLFVWRAKQDVGTALIKEADLDDNLGRIDSLPPEEQSIKWRWEHAKWILAAPQDLTPEEALKPQHLGNPRLHQKGNEEDFAGSQT